MPVLTDLLNQHQENHEQFAVRRIKIIAARFIAEKVIPTKSALAKRAGLSSVMITKPMVKQTIKDCLDHIKAELSKY